MVAPHPCWARDSRSASSSLEVPPQHATPEESKPPRVHSVGAGRCVASTRTRPSRCAVRDGQAYGTCTCVYIYALARALHVCAQLARLAILSRDTEGFRTIHETRADGIARHRLAAGPHLIEAVAGALSDGLGHIPLITLQCERDVRGTTQGRSQQAGARSTGWSARPSSSAKRCHRWARRRRRSTPMFLPSL